MHCGGVCAGLDPKNGDVGDLFRNFSGFFHRELRRGDGVVGS